MTSSHNRYKYFCSEINHKFWYHLRSAPKLTYKFNFPETSLMILSNQRYTSIKTLDLISSSNVSVLPQSKKISKANKEPAKRPAKENQNEDYAVLDTGYDIFLKEERDEILAILKRQILAFLGLDSSLMDDENLEWNDLFGEIGTKSLNQMLIKVIPQYVRYTLPLVLTNPRDLT